MIVHACSRAVSALLLGLLLATAAAADSPAQRHERMLQRRATEAAIWGMPLVNFHAMREVLREQAGVGLNDVAFFSRPQTWKLQFTTNNDTTPYVLAFWNTCRDGPLVFDLPAFADSGIGLFGTLLDAWQRPLEDVGTDGADRGRGGRYLLLPPAYQGPVEPGYIPLRQATCNGFTLLRPVIADTTDATLARMAALVQRIGIYPLAAAAQPPVTRHIDIYDRELDGIAHGDSHFFDRLDAMVQEEPVETKDLAMMGLLQAIGIGKGLAFAPDAATRALFDAAVREARDYMLDYSLERANPPYYGPGTHWRIATPASGKQTAFSWEMPAWLDLDGRAGIFRIGYTTVKRIGVASFYLMNGSDATGARLDGGRSYRLHVPAGVPARDFWSVLAHDADTAAWFRGQPRAGVNSLDKGLRRNADGSLDIVFAPVAPRDAGANWVPTVKGKQWFLLFRFYGPTAAAFDRSYRLPEVEPLD